MFFCSSRPAHSGLAFRTGGMSHEDAQHFVDTMPQQIIDEATVPDSDDEEGDSYGDSDGDSCGDSDGDSYGEGEEDSEEDSEGEGEGGGSKSVTLWKCVLEDGEGGKYKICDRESDHQVASSWL